MQPTEGWIELKDKTYKLYEFYKMADFRHVDFSHSKIAVARLGGPIAVTRNPAHIVIMKPEDPTRENICFYANSGDLVTKVPFV